MQLNINPNWNFRETVNHLKTLRDDYRRALASFSYFDLHEKVVFLRNTRDNFYALGFEEWRKDKIWDYMNGYEFLYVLKRMR